METMNEIREAILALEYRNGRRQFPKELKRRIIDYSKARSAEGAAGRRVAEELQMNGWTLQRWMQEEGKASKKEGASAAGFIEIPMASVKGGMGAKRFPEVREFCFEVICPSGFEVRVPSQFNGQALRQLLQNLEVR